MLDENQIKEFRQKAIQQLNEAKQQITFWAKKKIALEGSVAAYDFILKGQVKKKINKSPKEKPQ